MPERNSNSLSLLFAFLLMNSPGKQAVNPGSIYQRVEIALLFFVYVLKTNSQYSLKILVTPFLQMEEYCTLSKVKLI